jgi:hypothetical protein
VVDPQDFGLCFYFGLCWRVEIHSSSKRLWHDASGLRKPGILNTSSLDDYFSFYHPYRSGCGSTSLKGSSLDAFAVEKLTGTCYDREMTVVTDKTLREIESVTLRARTIEDVYVSLGSW